MEEGNRQKAAMAAVRAAMPRVQALVAERRKEFGDAWVTQCITRAMAGEPGWFFAKEGPLSFGTPWDLGEPAMGMMLKPVTPDQALVFICRPGQAPQGGGDA